jgi:hypothetical protein
MNGTSWTEVNDLNTARRQLRGAGTQTSALGFGGTPPGHCNYRILEWNELDRSSRFKYCKNTDVR